MVQRLNSLLLLALLLIAPCAAQAQTNPLGAGYSLSNGQLLVLTSPSLNSLTQPFTISFNVVAPTLTASQANNFIITNTSGSTTGGFSIGYSNATADSFRLKSQIQPSASIGGNACTHQGQICWRFPFVNDGDLHNVCVRWTQAQGLLYLDGIVRDQTSNPGAYATTPDSFWSIGLGAPSTWTLYDIRAYAGDIGAAGCVNLSNFTKKGVYPTTGSLSTGMVLHLPLDNCAFPGGGVVTCADTSGNGNNASNDAAPTVTITNPTTLGPFNGNLTITATCTDAVTCTQVQFLVNGESWATIAGVGPTYSTVFPTTLVNDSGNPNVITAIGTNATNVTTTVTQNFDTNNGAIPPATYYLSTTGSDSNNGTSIGTAWATPNHKVRCGDVIHVQPGSYNAATVGQAGSWGQVWTCPSNASPGVMQAIFLCDGTNIQACQFTTSSGSVDVLSPASNWAVIGMYASAPALFSNCFSTENTASGTQIYVAFINNYMFSCGSGAGLNDYTAHVGELIYGNAAAPGVGGGSCYSAISAFEPLNTNPSDTGTHMFVAGNFFINNHAPKGAGCVDGEAIILDTWQANGHYSGQFAGEQNLFVGNGSQAYEIFGNSPTNNIINTFFFSNTTWGDAQQGPPVDASGTTEVSIGFFAGVSGQCCDSMSNNIMVQTGRPGGGGNVVGLFATPFSTTPLFGNYIWNLVSATQFVFESNFNSQVPASSTGCVTSPTCPVNVYADPGLASPAQIASVPNCASSASAFACMTSLGIIANFKPSGGAASLGYQPPGSCTADAFFPTWLNGLKSYMTGLLTIPC